MGEILKIAAGNRGAKEYLTDANGVEIARRSAVSRLQVSKEGSKRRIPRFLTLASGVSIF